MIVFWCIRVFSFTLYESPKYLIGKGRDHEAFDTMQRVAAYNKTSTTLCIDDLKPFADSSLIETNGRSGFRETLQHASRSLFSVQDVSHVKALFKGRQMGQTTGLLIAIWGELFLTYRHTY